jgi:uncharacterized repeat protein (TIGR03803 family)
MKTLNLFSKLTAIKHAGFTTALFLLAVWLGASAHAGVVFTSLYSFTGTNDGAYPLTGLVQGSDGYLYGTTANEGGSLHTFVTSFHGGFRTNSSYGFGTVFKISTSGALTTLYAFGTVTTNAVVPTDGGNPQASLVQGSDGNFYGTTYAGGTNLNELAIFYYNSEFSGYGTVFKIDTNGVLTTLYAFGSAGIVEYSDGTSDYALDGQNPVAALVQGSDGNFYGTTDSGGGGDAGTVFKITTNGVLTSLYSFEAYDGAYPDAALVQGNDGYLYGTTLQGGVGWDDYTEINTAFGTVFKINPDMPIGSLGLLKPPKSLFTFGYTNGAGPWSGLIQGSDGNFYGTTSGFSPGQPGGASTVFKISTNLVLTTLYYFPGSSPRAGLVQGGDGSLYGTTYDGGTNNSGTVFKISPHGTGFTTLHTFAATSVDPNNANYATNSDGSSPRAGLILVGNTLYGTTSEGGASGVGTVFSLTLPVPPQLNIISDGANVILTWPANVTGYNDAGFILESATNLVPPVAWQTNFIALIIIGGQDVIINPMTGSQMFFRLSQ